MARIAGVTIPDNKKIKIALTYIFGVGNKRADEIIHSARIDENKRTDTLSSDEWGRIREVLEKNYKIEGDLRREIIMNIKRIKDISTYRGTRHIKTLPVRGQRTKTNSRTRRGNVRKTATSGKRSVDKK
jgi:small subunit ribosomal protein S13